MKQFLLLTSIFFLFQSCDNRCGTNTVCTKEYRTIGVYVEDSNGNPIVLDSLRVTQGSIFKAEDFGFSGYYQLVGDSDMSEIKKEGTPFHLKGWLDSKLVLDEDFLIGHDCCHVQKLEGVAKVIVD